LSLVTSLVLACRVRRGATSARVGQAWESHTGLQDEEGLFYTQDFDPVSDSLGLTAIIAALPIIALIFLLGGVKMRAQWAAPIALLVAIAVATAVYGMPVDQAALSAAEGATFGLFPIMWVVVAAIWVYNMTVETGHFAVLQRSITSVSDDQRIQAVLIAFCFGTLMEALAGFGAPAAITAVMMVALGFAPMKAAALALLGNTAAVPFGAIGIPITTLSEVTGLDQGDLGAMVGRQTPLLGLIVPFILLAIVDGRRGIREAWPVAAVGGLAFAIGQYACSNHLSVELTDVLAAIASIAAVAALLRLWKPAAPPVAEPVSRGDSAKDSPLDILRAYTPYLVIVAVFSIAQLPAVKGELATSPWTTSFQWPGLDIRNPEGGPVGSIAFSFNWLPAAGTLMLISGLITMAAIGLAPRRALRVARATLVQLRPAIFAVTAIVAVAYVVNQSGQTLTLGLWVAGAGSLFAFLAPVIGWLGVAITGSDTASNALFGGVHVTAANDTGLSPNLMAAANASGGVLGKMISAQHLAIAAAAVGLAGREGALFRKLAGWSIVLLLVMCALVYLQSTPLLEWMVVGD
jgi:lactate permease